MSDIMLPSADELNTSVKDWLADNEVEVSSEGVSSLVEDIARNRPRTTTLLAVKTVSHGRATAPSS